MARTEADPLRRLSGGKMSDMPTLPAIFFGHGNPMNALMDNEYTRAWRTIGEGQGRPRARLSISMLAVQVGSDG